MATGTSPSFKLTRNTVLLIHRNIPFLFTQIMSDSNTSGPIVRTGPTSLSLNTAEALQAVHTDRSANVMRGDWYRTLDQSSGAYSTQSCMDKQEHLFRRRILSQAFSERALRERAPRSQGSGRPRRI
jgi:cytochrome P450